MLVIIDQQQLTNYLQIYEFFILTFAFLYNVLLLQNLCQSDAFFVKKCVHMGAGTVVLPEHFCYPEYSFDFSPRHCNANTPAISKQTVSTKR